ncbi:FAD-dependent monooxygenase [Nocardia gamkensis]|uniref:FAD-dependent monooxygenase n=1 Tax=Nocardia gamkensis TaxID=352869 RepID=UPI0036E38AF8
MLRVLFPHLDRIVIGAVRVAGSTVRIDAATREEPVACPDCSEPSRRVHSWCRRRLADNAITGRQVVIGLRVRRLFDDKPVCARRSFAEYEPARPVRPSPTTHRSGASNWCGRHRSPRYRSASACPQRLGYWRFVADEYRQGRTILVGDAAHRHAPWGGYCGSTVSADAHNLAWKLAATLSGAADPWLLDTYEAERRPSALVAAEQSNLTTDFHAR